MLGKLARWLKIAGWDVSYSKERDLKSLLKTAKEENRIILTRDYSLAKEKNVFIIESEDVWEQLDQLFRAFGPLQEEKFFSRCIICNRELEPADRESVKDKAPPYVFETHKVFSRCPDCGRIYWPGSHYKRIKEKLSQIMKKVKGGIF
jgi:uncharacterized protein with PIN domain